MRSTFNDAYAVLFAIFLYKNIQKMYVVVTCLNCLDLYPQHVFIKK